MWLSFAWTKEPLVAREKTVTRRSWKPEYAAKFKRGDLVQAYDRRPSWGGQPIALLQLTADPRSESTGRIPNADWEREGFMYMHQMGLNVGKETPLEIWKRWQEEPEDMYVIRFNVVEVYDSDN